MSDSANATLIVRVDPARVTVRPDEQATATIIIENPLPDPVHYQLRVGPEARAWAEIFPNQGQVFPGQQARARLHLNPPADQPSDLYRVSILASGVETRDRVARAELAVYVAEPVRETAGAGQAIVVSHTIEVTTEAVEDSPLPPPARQWRINVRNTSDIVDTFAFSTEGIRANWAIVEPIELTLRPDQSRAALLSVRPDAGVAGGDYSFTLNVFSTINPQQLTQVRLAYGVASRARFSLTARPEVIESEGEAEFELRLISELDNNTTLQLDLVATDEADRCECLCEPSEIALGPGRSATSRLRVAARALLNPDERRDHVITIHATARPATPAPTQSAVARMGQRGVRPPTLELQPRQQRGEREAQYTLRLSNPAAVDTTLLLEGKDDEDELEYRFEPAEVVVPGRGNAEVKVLVRARAYWEQESPNSVTFAVMAQRPNSRSAAVQTTGIFVQQPVKPLAIEIIPSRLASTGRVRYHVRVRNSRPEPVAVTLDAQAEADALEFGWQGRAFQLMPRAEGSATLTVRSKYRLTGGEDHHAHDFTVRADVGEAATAPSASGRFVQERGFDWFRLMRLVAIWGFVIMVVWSVLALTLDGLDQLQLSKFEREGDNALTTYLRNIVGNPVSQGLRRLPLPFELRGLIQWLVRCQFIPC